jgi:hypothetical protein
VKAFEGVKTPVGLFFWGILFLGINQGIMNSTFNNYLYDSFQVSAAQRGFLEFPRELPGFLIVLVTGLLSIFSMRVWLVLVGLFSCAGVVGLGVLSPHMSAMVLWVIVWNLADHLFMPVESAMGLMLANKGGAGRRLGQIGGMRNFAMIGGTALVWLLMSESVKTSYAVLYVVAGFFALAASLAFSRVRLPEDKGGIHRAFVFRKKYILFYALNVLWGARKQVFLTFAPWVLVSHFGVSASTMAFLLMIAATLGVFFRQAFGSLVDKWGERAVLSIDAVVMLGICLGFALSAHLYLLFALYVLDNLMFATRIARTTYLGRIAVEKSDIPATLSLGISVDHAVSMTIPALGGLLWAAYGYPAVFFAAAGVAVLGFWAAQRVE